jgi:hypothetical protein
MKIKHTIILLYAKFYGNVNIKYHQITYCCMLSFGWFPGIWILRADVSEHSVCSIFIGGVSLHNIQNTAKGWSKKNKLLFEKQTFISLLIVFSWTQWVENIMLIVNQAEILALNSRLWNSKESDRFSTSLQVWYNCSSEKTSNKCHNSTTQKNLYQIWYFIAVFLCFRHTVRQPTACNKYGL